MDYLNLGGRKDLYWFAIPNGGFRHIRVATALKAEGVRAGTPDLCFLLPEGRVAWLEMKAAKGHLSPDQKQFRDKALSLNHHWAVANDVDEAIRIISSWGVLRSAYARTEAFHEAAKIHLNLARAIQVTA